MAYASFSQFLTALDQAGELERITTPVETDLVIAEWADREMKSPRGGKALLFEQPMVDGEGLEISAGDQHHGLGEADGARASGRERGRSRAGNSAYSQSETADRSARRLEPAQAGNQPAARAAEAREIGGLPGSGPPLRGSDVQRSTFNDSTIRRCSICRSSNAGRRMAGASSRCRTFIRAIRRRARATSGCTGCRFTTTCTTGMHWQVHKVGARHGKLYYERNERMPVAVTLGGDPAYTFAATAPLPDGLDEILFAGFVRKKSVELVKCLTNDLEVPADVDFVLEGYVQPGETRPEGPFGDHTGFYTRGRGLPGLPSHRHHASARRGLSRPPSSAFRRWRIFISARRACGFSCRSSK